MNADYLDGQFWIGVRMGGMLSKAVPKERFSIYDATVENANPYDKKYDNFKKLTANVGLDLSYSYKGFGASFQPNLQRMNARFNSGLAWVDNDSAQNSLEYRYENRLIFDYLELPLYFKYEFTKWPVWPYGLVGLSYSRLLTSFRSAKVTAVDRASGGNNEFVLANYSSGSKDMFIPSLFRLNLGLGVAFPIENFKLCADVMYRMPLHQITNQKSRYDDDQLIAAGDLMDNVVLSSWALNISCLIPMKFLYDKHYRAF